MRSKSWRREGGGGERNKQEKKQKKTENIHVMFFILKEKEK